MIPNLETTKGRAASSVGSIARLICSLLRLLEKITTFVVGDSFRIAAAASMALSSGSFLVDAKVSDTVRMKRARHSSWKQTDGYTDEKSIRLVKGIAQLAAILPSSIASPNFGKRRPNVGKPVQTSNADESEKDGVLRGETPVLAMAVPTWQDTELVPEGGLEPPCG